MTERAASPPAAPSAVPGRPRIVGVSSHERRSLHDGWTTCAVAPNAATDPHALASLTPEWSGAVVPGTVAAALRRDGVLELERAPDFDASDWWYRCRFPAELPRSDTASVLCFDGLATLAEVWLNGQRVLASDNMFVAHEVDVSAVLKADNELTIRFRSLRAALGARRPRPRWRTKVVEHQQLRWQRVTLLGRMPGWSPPVRAVGPWRGIRLERRRGAEVVRGDVHPVADLAERGGRVDVALTIRPVGGAAVRAASLHVGTQATPLALSPTARGEVELRGVLSVPDAAHWWPHTHGAQPRYDARVVLDTSAGEVTIALGPVAFRRVQVDTTDDGFTVMVNGVSLFCRGACWTTPDIVTLDADEATYRTLLALARDAGMNMLRIGGTMVYESDCFYDLCDELGILVWQDFMFANMDYPAADPAFLESVDREAEHVLARLRRHPSLAVLCGNSEVEQQAAMLGLDRELWSNAIFRELLPARCAEGAPGVPYWPASPGGGALPFHVDVGVAHYYGVGAYLRPLDDARRSGVRFTSECLGFSNVPDPRAIDALLPNGESPFHHPRWKARVPRDHGTGWDFDDVRDHYLAALFAVDPMRLRYAEMDRYLALSRIATGEVMTRTIGEWRRAGSSCRGALVWFYQDLWLGAGWGVIDSEARPKAAYYALKRAMQPVAVAITDEGANGLHVQIANDHAIELRSELTLVLLRGGTTVVASATAPVVVAARGAAVLGADAILGSFHDSAYAYRFGPPGHDVVAATLRDGDGRVLGEAWHFPLGLPTVRSDDVYVSGYASRIAEDVVAVTLRAERFAQSVALDTGDFVPEDNYFHMAPGSERIIVARARATGGDLRFDGFAQPLNAYEGTRIVLRARETAREPADTGVRA